MKLKSIMLTATIAVLMVAGVGCSKAKFEINQNPDDVTDISVTPSVLLPGALQATSTIAVQEWWFIGWWMGHGARSGSFQSLNEEETYAFTNDFHVNIWNSLYANANNYNLMIDKAKVSGSGTYEAIGRIMKSHNFQMLVDVYGNIPYSDAFKGTVSPTPAYDKAIDVYKGIFADLDAAITLLNNATLTDKAANPDIETSDIVYKGDVKMWKKFANTLRLRMLVHLYNGTTTQTVAPGIDVAAQMAKITSDGYIGAGESAHLNPGFTGTKPNPYFRLYNTNESGTASQRDHLRASEYAIDYYVWNGDYRINYTYKAPVAITNSTSASGTQVSNFFTAHNGIPFGTPSSASAPTGAQLSSVRGDGLTPKGAESRAWILTSVESLFLQSEARQRNIITSGPSAKDLLTAAVRESFVWLDAKQLPLRDVRNTRDSVIYTPIESADKYLANNAGYPDVDYDAAALGAGLPAGGIYTILQQKWFALNAIAPYEVWTDFRRTAIKYGVGSGYTEGPTLSVDPNNQKKTIPVRMFYPQNEFNYNAANVAKEGTIDVFTTRIFWDLN